MRAAVKKPRVLGLASAMIALAAMALYKLWAQALAGAQWDTYSFLANAAAIAGRGYGYSEPARPPLMSVLAAPLLRFGLMSPFAIQLVDFVFGMLLLAGLFLLVRRRMGALPAALASLAALMAPPVWEWFAVGYTDIGAVALCTWALLAVIKATEEDPRYYAAAFALIVMAALMRTTSLLFVLPFGVWMLLRTNAFRHARYLAAGAVTALAVYLPFGIYYAVAIGDPLYPFATSLKIKDSASGAATVTREIGSYLTGLPILAAPKPVAALTLLVLFVAVGGIALSVFRSLRSRGVSTRRMVGALILISGAGVVVARSGLMASQVVVAATVYLTWRLLASEEHVFEGGHARIVPVDLALDATVVAWLLGYYGFHEAWAQRVTRYYITMAPQIAYLVALGWWQLHRSLSEAPSPARESESLAPPRDPFTIIGRWLVAPIVALIVVSFAFDIAGTKTTPNADIIDSRDTAYYIAEQSYTEATVVYSDMWPMTAWYMQRGVLAMPTYDDSAAVDHELDKGRATYFVSKGGRSATPPPGFDLAFTAQTQRVLKRASAPPQLPTVPYFGAGWENYLEEIGDYRFYLLHSEGEFDVQGSRFYDAFTLEELSRYPVIVGFGGMWHDRGAAERLLMSYVEQGGTLMLDASGNLTEPNRLDGSVLFDTVIGRTRVPSDAVVGVAPAFAANYPELGSLTPSPWVSETGEPWFGASYTNLPGSEPLNVLATLGGKPLVAERRWGKGRVIWLAYNLPFHAKLSGNAGEARLISAVISEATRQKTR